MNFSVSRTPDEEGASNRLVLKRPRPTHISVLLRSNSGAIPIANRSYRILIGDRVLEGTTDENGLVYHPNVPPGDHPMIVEGAGEPFLVSALPTCIVRSPVRAPGLFLFCADDSGRA